MLNRICTLPPVAPGNPFLSDGYHMGTSLSFAQAESPYYIMYDHTLAYLIIVDVRTGERIKLSSNPTLKEENQ